MHKSAGKPLEGQVVVISGGLGDIGRALARELGQRGASVALSDRRPEVEAQRFLEELRAQHITCRYWPVSVENAVAVEHWIAEVETALGPPSLAIPCAAVVTRAGLRTLTPGQWRTELHINLDGVFHVALCAARAMAAKGAGGRIVFLGSWVADRPQPRITTYCVGKAALRMLMKCMALEFAGDGILVNEVAPGYVDAGLTGTTLKADPARRTALLEETPLHALVETEEIAAHVAHLCDPKTRTATGGVFLIDGGVSLRAP